MVKNMHISGGAKTTPAKSYSITAADDQQIIFNRERQQTQDARRSSLSSASKGCGLGMQSQQQAAALHAQRQTSAYQTRTQLDTQKVTLVAKTPPVEPSNNIDQQFSNQQRKKPPSTTMELTVSNQVSSTSTQMPSKSPFVQALEEGKVELMLQDHRALRLAQIGHQVNHMTTESNKKVSRHLYSFNSGDYVEDERPNKTKNSRHLMQSSVTPSPASRQNNFYKIGGKLQDIITMDPSPTQLKRLAAQNFSSNYSPPKSILNQTVGMNMAQMQQRRSSLGDIIQPSSSVWQTSSMIIDQSAAHKRTGQRTIAGSEATEDESMRSQKNNTTTDVFRNYVSQDYSKISTTPATTGASTGYQKINRIKVGGAICIQDRNSVSNTSPRSTQQKSKRSTTYEEVFVPQATQMDSMTPAKLTPLRQQSYMVPSLRNMTKTPPLAAQHSNLCRDQTFQHAEKGIRGRSFYIKSVATQDCDLEVKPSFSFSVQNKMKIREADHAEKQGPPTNTLNLPDDEVKSENSANESVGLDPYEKLLMLEKLNYGGTTTLRNSVNKEAANKLIRINHSTREAKEKAEGSFSKAQYPGAEASAFSGNTNNLQKLRSIDKTVVVRKPQQQVKGNKLAAADQKRRLKAHSMLTHLKKSMRTNMIQSVGPQLSINNRADQQQQKFQYVPSPLEIQLKSSQATAAASPMSNISPRLSQSISPQLCIQGQSSANKVSNDYSQKVQYYSNMVVKPTTSIGMSRMSHQNNGPIILPGPSVSRVKPVATPVGNQQRAYTQNRQKRGGVGFTNNNATTTLTSIVDLVREKRAETAVNESPKNVSSNQNNNETASICISDILQLNTVGFTNNAGDKRRGRGVDDRDLVMINALTGLKPKEKFQEQHQERLNRIFHSILSVWLNRIDLMNMSNMNCETVNQTSAQYILQPKFNNNHTNSTVSNAGDASPIMMHQLPMSFDAATGNLTVKILPAAADQQLQEMQETSRNRRAISTTLIS